MMMSLLAPVNVIAAIICGIIIVRTYPGRI